MKNLLLFLLLAMSFSVFSQKNNLRSVLVVKNNTSAINVALSNNSIVFDSTAGLFYHLPSGVTRGDNLDSVSDKLITKVDDTALEALELRYETDSSAKNIVIASIIKVDTLLLDSAYIVALNATPQIVVAAPGAGYANIILSAWADYTYADSEYTGDTTLTLYYHGNDAFMENIGAIDTTISKITAFKQASGSIGVNKAIYVKSPTSDPVGGGGTVRIYVMYRKEKIH